MVKSQVKFLQVVQMVFFQCCKMLCNMLKGMLSDVGFVEFGIDLICWVEDILVEDYVCIVNYLM